MPIVFYANRPTLVCANREHGHPPGHAQGTTMQAAPGWHALLSADPPATGQPPNINANSFMPLKIYVCTVCGYVESYAAGVTNPETWRGGR